MIFITISDFILQMEQYRKEQDALYHRAAIQFGLTDTAMLVLYLVSDRQGACTQQELCRKSFYAKQTINTALAALVRQGYAILEPIAGNRNQKNIRLTTQGLELARRTTDRLRQAELRAYSRLTPAQMQAYLDTTDTINSALREELTHLTTEGDHL